MASKEGEALLRLADTLHSKYCGADGCDPECQLLVNVDALARAVKAMVEQRDAACECFFDSICRTCGLLNIGHAAAFPEEKPCESTESK